MSIWDNKELSFAHDTARMPDIKLDTSRNLTSHLQNQQAGSLVCAAKSGIDATLRDMRESGLFCKDEIDEMLQSDSKTITVSKDQVILKWVKLGPSASEIRQFTIHYNAEEDEAATALYLSVANQGV